MHRITFYTRQNCHLCDSARYELDRVLAGRADVAVEQIDIDTAGQLRARYNDHVPVILLDGNELSRHRLDVPALVRSLNRPANAGP